MEQQSKFVKNHFHREFSLHQVLKSNGRKYSVRDDRQRYFFPDEWLIFYDALDKKENIYSKQEITFNTLLHTGARIMEVQNIKVQDIDLERGNIVLRVTKKIVNRPGIDKFGTMHIRVVTVSSKFIKFLRKVIKDYDLKDQDYLPIITTQGANQAMKRTLKKIGLPDWQMLSLHNVRKTNENWLLAMGVAWNKVIKQLGHSANVSLRHYLSSDIFSFEEKRQIREIMGDIREKMMGDVYGFK